MFVQADRCRQISIGYIYMHGYSALVRIPMYMAYINVLRHI